MKNIERAVAEHYESGGLLGRIMAGLEAAGADLDNLRPVDLAPVDEFHVGGRQATAHAVGKMSLSGEEHVLDIGCGLGGTARYIASETGCEVTGIDLTPEFISTAKALTAMTGLNGKTNFEVANALAMPFESESFDAAITLHVAMNIPERQELYGEIARVIKPGAVFCLYDMMKKGHESPAFPVPWAQSPETSHLTTPEETRALLEDAGFEIREVDDRTDFALDFLRRRSGAMAEGPPPLGLHLVMGPSAPEKFKNMLSNCENGRTAPVQIIATKK